MVMAAILVMWPRLFEQTCIRLCHKGFIWIWLQLAQLYFFYKKQTIKKQKKQQQKTKNKQTNKQTSFNFDIWVTFDQGHWVTLTFGTHAASLIQLVDCIYQFKVHREQQYSKN